MDRNSDEYALLLNDIRDLYIEALEDGVSANEFMSDVETLFFDYEVTGQ